MSETLKDRIALVTGGSRGIGRAISVELARLGAHVYVNFSSSPQAAEETVKLCEEVGGKATLLGFNVSKGEEVEKAFDSVREKSGKLDILVNNAGITKDGLFVRLKEEDWRQVLAVNLDGAFLCARAAAKIMMKNRYGRIVNISSVVGEMGNAGQAAYVSSKAAVNGLTKALARELGSRNVTVNSITPGFIETDMTHGLSEDLRAEHLKAIPLGRYGDPTEVANLVGFLAQEGAGYITGQIIGINGGMYM
jgi:3-oxoacyl-[acyl-carrier protein] reductase